MAECVLTGGPDRTIEVDGAVLTFEDHTQFGPCPVDAKGRERHLQRDEFAITWRKQWILYALGQEGGLQGLDEVWAFLESR